MAFTNNHTTSTITQDADQLALREGDIIDVVEDDDDGWTRGILNGVEGMLHASVLVRVCQ